MQEQSSLFPSSGQHLHCKVKCSWNTSKYVHGSFHSAPAHQQRHNNADLCMDKQSSQIFKLPVETVAAKATNCIHQHCCRSHQVKTHHWHILFHSTEVVPREIVNFLSMKPFSCTFQSKHQDSESIIIPTSNIAKKYEAAMNAHEYKTSGLGRCFS